MITIEDKTYRNLEEQVQYLTDMILKATDVVKNIVGKVTLPANLPSATLYSPGDTFAVGSTPPYAYYVQIGGAWVSIGTFPLQGPAGTDGEDGYNVYFSSAALTSSSTSVLTSTFNNPESHSINEGDFVIGGSDACLFIITAVSSGTATILYKGSLKGPQGATGSTGPAGADGVGFNNATQMSIPLAVTGATISGGNLNFTGTARVVAGGQNYDMYLTFAVPLAQKSGGMIALSLDIPGTGVEIGIDKTGLSGWYVLRGDGLGGLTWGKVIVSTIDTSAANNGKSLITNNGIADWGSPSVAGTSVTSLGETAGKFLVSDGYGGASWVTVPDAGNQGV